MSPEEQTFFRRRGEPQGAARRSRPRPYASVLGWIVRSSLDRVEQSVYEGERERPGADDGAGRDRAPQGVGAGEFPDGEHRGDDGDQDAAGRDPEGKARDQRGLHVASPGPLPCLRAHRLFIAISRSAAWFAWMVPGEQASTTRRNSLAPGRTRAVRPEQAPRDVRGVRLSPDCAVAGVFRPRA